MESLSLRRSGSVAFRRRGRRTRAAPARDGRAPVRLWRFLPLAVLTTASVVVLPGALVAAVVPRGGALSMAVSAAAAVAFSIAIASVEAALWMRQPRSRDLVFADLMLWGWLRRCWAERRLAQARDLYHSARKAGPAVSIELLEGLSKQLEARDAYTHGHSRRVARHAGRIARALRLSPAEIAKIRTAATVHDVGKLYTPREILNNPGRLTDREFAIAKLHAGDGADMLAGVGDPDIAAMVRHHHERIDGHGYPDGLAGSDIPLGARIIAVADTFDAITSSRAYRPAATHKKALDVLSHEAGSQLDRAAVTAFLGRYSARRPVAWLAFAAAVPARIFAGLQTASSSLGVGALGSTSILPALGAAGLLTFAPGLHHGAPVDRSAHRQATVTRSHRLTAPVALTAAAVRHRGPAASIHTTSPARRPSRRTVSPAPSTPVSRNRTAGKPNAPKRGTGTGTSTREPAATTPTQPPTTSSPQPSPPPPPPAKEASTLPELPVSPPVTVPSAPEVPLPSVKISTKGLSIEISGHS
jgi:HD-GYP domain-containing protein (c-di-GMP phosphodiesterase class II)